MRVNEIFFSLQGEGLLTGAPTVFIRTGVCNLACNWCDTNNTTKKHMSIERIIYEVEKYSCNEVCITGGEPLLERNLAKLCRELFNKGKHVSIETNGTEDIKRFKHVDLIIDVKCPSSGEWESFRWENVHYIKPNDQIKFVIKDKKDFDYACKVIDGIDRGHILFSPVFTKSLTIARRLAKWMMQKEIAKKARLSLQIHKLLLLR